jgi:hypothetical protein
MDQKATNFWICSVSIVPFKESNKQTCFAACDWEVAYLLCFSYLFHLEILFSVPPSLPKADQLTRGVCLYQLRCLPGGTGNLKKTLEKRTAHFHGIIYQASTCLGDYMWAGLRKSIGIWRIKTQAPDYTKTRSGRQSEISHGHPGSEPKLKVSTGRPKSDN